MYRTLGPFHASAIYGIITYILQEIYKSHWIQNERHRNEIKQSIHAHTCTIILKHVFIEIQINCVTGIVYVNPLQIHVHTPPRWR